MEGSKYDFTQAEVMIDTEETEPVWMDSVRLVLALEAARNGAAWRLEYAETSGEEVATRQNIDQLNREINAVLASLDHLALAELTRLRDERLKAR